MSVCVRNLSSNLTEVGVHDLFEHYGPISSVQPIKDGWEIVYEDGRDSEDAKRDLMKFGGQGMTTDSSHQELTEEYFYNYGPIASIEKTECSWKVTYEDERDANDIRTELNLFGQSNILIAPTHYILPEVSYSDSRDSLREYSLII